jgi:hypothetical protein
VYEDDGKLSAQFDHRHFHTSKDADRFAIILRGDYQVPLEGPSAARTSAIFQNEFNRITQHVFEGFDWSNVSLALLAQCQCHCGMLPILLCVLLSH